MGKGNEDSNVYVIHKNAPRSNEFKVAGYKINTHTQKNPIFLYTDEKYQFKIFITVKKYMAVKLT